MSDTDAVVMTTTIVEVIAISGMLLEDGSCCLDYQRSMVCSQTADSTPVLICFWLVAGGQRSEASLLLHTSSIQRQVSHCGGP